MHQPLAGIRVLDFGQIYQGPYCGLILSFLGADVLKIEPPGGENIRYRGKEGQKEGRHEQFLNSNKRSIELNLKTEEGRTVLEDLVAEADVLLENYSPGTMEKLGVGYDTLSEINPQLIYAQGSGYGSDGPYRDYPAMDLTIQATGGVMDCTGYPDGPPTKTGPAIADFLGGIHLATGIVSALYQREVTGEGQYLEVAMLDCIYPALTSRVAAWARDDDVPARTGNLHTGLALHPYADYEAEDGYFVIACVTEQQWEMLAKLVSHPELLDDERLQTVEGRANNRDVIDTAINDWAAGKTRDEAVAALREANVPCAPVQNTDEVVHDPHLEHRGMVNWQSNKGDGRSEVPVPGMPIKFAGSDEPEVELSPRLGEHSEEILQEVLGYSDEMIAELTEKDVI